MSFVRGFPPIGRPDARTLILGSMPGRESLRQQRYYAYARNGFWPIMTDLFRLTGERYEEKVLQLTNRKVAVWDVLKACFRSGSLDSEIDEKSIVTNDFRTFFRDHPAINRVFFNGAKAESIYRRHVLPGLEGTTASLELRRLPSSSPAHAALTIEQKREAWRVLLEPEGKF